MADNDAQHRTWSTEKQRWIYPGEPNAAILKLAFWEAIERCNDPPYVGDEDTGDVGFIAGHLPEEFWGHMAETLTSDG